MILMFLIVAIPAFQGKNNTDNEDLSVENKIEELCDSVYGVSDSKVVITYEVAKEVSMFDNKKEHGRILGIAVLCKGGGNPDIQLKLQEMLKSLFQVSSTQITIGERK